MNLIKISPSSNYKRDRLLDDNDILLIEDVFDQSVLNLLLQVNKPRYIVNDHFSWSEFDNVFTVPRFLSMIVANYQGKVPLASTKIITDHPFNFTINKRQCNRFLLLKLLQWFKLDTKNFYWMTESDNRFDISPFQIELNSISDQVLNSSDFRSFLCEQHVIPPRYLKDATYLSDIHQQDLCDFWEKFLNPFMSTSAVCMITESVNFQKASVFTEKTLFSVLSMNFPLWVGGYAQAREWQRLGFDIFDDVIDHGYQYCNTLLERCYKAINDNLPLLTDVDFVRDIRFKNHDRLWNNLNLLLSGHVEQQVSNIINQLPNDLNFELKKYWS
jgi:hypothetical protein